MSKRKVSCLPCRLKKVKCDGENPCNRCQSKSVTCVYQKPRTVGRPPKNAVINKLVLSRNANNNRTITFTETTTNTFCKEFIFENISNTPELTSVRYLEDSKTHGLQHYISELFTTVFTALGPIEKMLWENGPDRADFLSVVPKFKVFNLTHFFAWMSADIANILVRRISRLKLVYYNDLEFSRTGLKYDCTTTFFEPPSENALVMNPLNSIPPQQAIRLIECFFCIHPYSNLFNKTLLLQSYWTDTADPLLLSVIYGTTVYKTQLLDGRPLQLWEGMDKKNRNPFLDYAYVLLSKASAEATPTRYQAVVLLALFEVAFGYPKRGMALFCLSHMLAAKLGLFDNTLPAGLNPVEKELILVTFWAGFDCSIRGCIELERLPKSTLASHRHPYPPATVKESKSYQFDLENNNPRLSKNYEYLVETFFIQSVIARVTCQLMSHLPDSYASFVFKSVNIKVIDKSAFEKHMEKSNIPPVIKEGVDKVLVDFKTFINENKMNWSKLQEFTFEICHSFLSICLTFLRETNIGDDGMPGAFGIYDLEEPTQLDLTNFDNVLKINLLVPEAVNIIEKCFDFISEPKFYYEQADFLPRGLIINGIDAAVQILMYSYKLGKSTKIRHYLQLAKAILGFPNVWIDWNTAVMIKSAVHQFLEENPVEVAINCSFDMNSNSNKADGYSGYSSSSSISVTSTNSSSNNSNISDSSKDNSISSSKNNISNINNTSPSNIYEEIDKIIFNSNPLDILKLGNINNLNTMTSSFPLMQQPSSIETFFPTQLLSLNTDNHYNDLVNNPWLTGEETWIQDMNNILFSNDSYGNPLFQQQDKQQDQLEFNDLTKLLL